MRKVVIKILQGSVVTQNVLGGLTIHLPVANFLCFISAKNYENWLRVDKVIAMNTVCSFLAHPVYLASKQLVRTSVNWLCLCTSCSIKSRQYSNTVNAHHLPQALFAFEYRYWPIFTAFVIRSRVCSSLRHNDFLP